MAVLVVTVAYTGLRWGELTRLHWYHVDLTPGDITIASGDGALHELGGRLYLGAPKIKAGVAAGCSPLAATYDVAGRRCCPACTSMTYATPKNLVHRWTDSGGDGSSRVRPLPRIEGVTTYSGVDHTKIVCSQFAPTTAKKPISEDH
ncbi:hypothetical protein ACFV4N_18710 [Actinosynnema sp. NPDC059797]